MGKESMKEELIAYITRERERHYRVAYSYVKNAHDALDVIQEAVYKALLSVGQLREREHIRSWFYRILINCANDLLRKRNRGIPADPMEELLAEGTYDTYRDLDLKDALAALPRTLGIVVVLRYFEDMKLEDIAHVTNENLSTTKTRLYRALRRLKTELE